MQNTSVGELVRDLFRRESAHLVSALVRLLGPANLALAEDVVHDALQSALQAWRFGVPDDPKAWILQVAKNRALDLIRRERRLDALRTRLGAEDELAGALELGLSPEADAQNQLAMMFAICDDGLSSETHVSLILRFLGGLSAPEIARAFLVDVQTIDRRLRRGRTRLKALGQLHDVSSRAEVRARQPSVEQALYPLFNEGYHGSDADSPLAPALCADALRLAELMLEASAVERSTVHALSALFCLNAARLPARLDEAGIIVPLAEQDRSRWDRSLIQRGLVHLSSSAEGEQWTRFHLEAGIAFEHSRASSVKDTDWAKIVEYYDTLSTLSPSPVVALNRALALAEQQGLSAGREALLRLEGEPKLARTRFIGRRARISSDAPGRSISRVRSTSARSSSRKAPRSDSRTNGDFAASRISRAV